MPERLDPDRLLSWPTPVIVHLSGGFRGLTQRLLGDRLRIGARPDAEIEVAKMDLPPGSIGEGDSGDLATLERRGEDYELRVEPGRSVWVNGKKAERKVLDSGDVMEVEQGGPMLRYRLYAPGFRPYKSLGEVVTDCVDCARHAGKNPLRQAGVLMTGMPRELFTQTSPWFRLILVAMLAILAVGVGWLSWRSFELGEQLAAEQAMVRKLLDEAESRTVSTESLAAARAALEGRVEALETRAGARERVIATASRSVVFVQGAYGFVEEVSGRPLRFVLSGPGGEPSFPPEVTLEGDGPILEVFYTGTAFVATAEGDLFTNRHVAVPWEYDEAALEIAGRGFQPVMRRFIGYLPGLSEPFDVVPVRTSDRADVALLRCSLDAGLVPPLELSAEPPSVGDEVIVLGYPTGMHAILARTDPAVAEALLQGGPVDFWGLARGLAAGGHISPLATVGVVGQTTATTVVYDAETTHGGSGGPVLGLDGSVVAVNAAVLADFTGSNLGVPAEEALRLLVSDGGVELPEVP